MSARPWTILIFSVIFTAAGLGAGWYGAWQRYGKTAAAEEPHDDHGDKTLSAVTLKNLGVEWAPIEPGEFVRYRSIAAVVTHTPRNERPLYAPLGGIVDEVLAEQGTVVAKGTVLVRLIRDPIERPTLAMTEEIVKPAGENMHESVAAVRQAANEVTILEAELARVKPFTGGENGNEDLPLVPKDRRIQLQYGLDRARQTLERTRHELERHGLSEAQITAIIKQGEVPSLGEKNWKGILVHNGLWPASAEALYGTLPEALRGRPWVIATIGELAAGGLDSADLIDWLKATPAAATHFLEIGALLQKGYSVTALKRLHELDAFARVIEIKAPADMAADDWDVLSLNVKTGQHVTAGQPLVTLLNPRRMYLKLEPVGAEKSSLLKVVEQGLACRAEPLIEGAGPVLEDLRVAFLTDDEAHTGTEGFAEVVNQPLGAKEDAAGHTHRSWQLRAGMRYNFRIPVDTFKKVYVLPSEAVTEDGVKKIVFVKLGEKFEPREVEIAWQDHRQAVIGINKHTTLFSGDVVVTRGAFALGIAMKAGEEGEGGHAHHGHAH